MAGVKGRRHPGAGLRQVEAAQILDVTQAHVSQMVRRGQIQMLPDGTIDPQDPQLLRAQGIEPPPEPKRRGRKPKAKTGPAIVDHIGPVDLNFHRTRLEKARADRAELEYEAARGNLVDKRLMEETAVGLYSMVREGIEDAVERLASLISSRYGIAEPELRALIGDHMHESLERLADEMEEMAQ